MKKLFPVILVCLLGALVFAGTASASTLTLAKLAKQVAALQKKVNAQAATIAGQNSTITALSSRVTADEATIAGQGVKITGLSTDLAGALSAVTALQNAPVTVGQSQFDALAAKVTTAQGDIATLKSGMVDVAGSMGQLTSSYFTLGSKQSADEQTLAEHTAILQDAAPVLAVAPYLSVTSGALYGTKGPNVVFSGANVHIVDGTGHTWGNGTRSGLGNLLVGYNEGATTCTGAHNIVCGRENNFSSYGGLVAGEFNDISGVCASITGGVLGVASGGDSSILGGRGNKATSDYATVSGGAYNTASQWSASVSGGQSNTASGSASSISGGGSGSGGLTESTNYGWMAGTTATNSSTPVYHAP
jgi:hypothetical protein